MTDDSNMRRVITYDLKIFQTFFDQKQKNTHRLRIQLI